MKRSDFLIGSGAAGICGVTLSGSVTLSLSKGDTAETFTESPIELHTSTGTIYGTFCTPTNAKPNPPIVLIIAGSGPTDRDGNNPLLAGKNDALLLLAHGLASRGVASVRYDKRGIAASAAAMTAEKDLRFDTYVDDAITWIRLAREQHAFSHVTVAGHSEGALIGTIAAAKSKTHGLVTLEGAGRRAATIVREQLKPKLAADMYALADRVLTRLQSGQLYNDALPPELFGLFHQSVQPYLISWFKYDPAAEIAKVRAPTAIVQGTADVQVTMTDAQALHGGDPRAKLVVVNGMNHVLKHAPDTTSQAAVLRGYTDPSLPVDPLVISTVADIALT